MKHTIYKVFQNKTIKKWFVKNIYELSHQRYVVNHEVVQNKVQISPFIGTKLNQIDHEKTYLLWEVATLLLWLLSAPSFFSIDESALAYFWSFSCMWEVTEWEDSCDDFELVAANFSFSRLPSNSVILALWRACEAWDWGCKFGCRGGGGGNEPVGQVWKGGCWGWSMFGQPWECLGGGCIMSCQPSHSGITKGEELWFGTGIPMLGWGFSGIGRGL